MIGGPDAVVIRAATKRFGSTVALDGVDLTVVQGKIHALVGENGAGKTTLMRALYGSSPLDSGSMTVFGQPARFSTSAEAIRAGVGMVTQHYGIIPELTNLQNLILGSESGFFLTLAAKRARAEELAASMAFKLNWDAPSSELSPSGMQRLEILRLLWRKARLMILDEPTAMLAPADGEALFSSLRSLVQREGATVILVTHRLPEVFDHCESVTVLRGGRLIAAMATSETSPGELARAIVGGDLLVAAPLPPPQSFAPRLEITSLRVTDASGGERLQGVNLTVGAGEVVGIAGVDGNGQRELFAAILGMTSAMGIIRLNGQALDRAPTAERLAQGIRLIAEDRHAEGVIEGWSLEENAALGRQREVPFARRGMIQPRARRARAERIAARFGTRFGSLRQRIGSLSGGNQQRFVAARALDDEPSLILAFQPARGLDLNSTMAVYQGIREACSGGSGAIVVSFDLDELLTHCDRIVVLSHGRLIEPARRDRVAIGEAMVGGA